MKLSDDARRILQDLAGSETLAKALLITARGKRDAKPAEGRGPYSHVREWPALETPTQAQWHWDGFAAQGESGEAVLDQWRQEGEKLIEAILAIDGAEEAA